MNKTPHIVDVDYVERLLAEIQSKEQFKRYHDAAEGKDWFRTTVAREANEHALRPAYGRLREALNASFSTSRGEE